MSVFFSAETDGLEALNVLVPLNKMLVKQQVELLEGQLTFQNQDWSIFFILVQICAKSFSKIARPKDIDGWMENLFAPVQDGINSDFLDPFIYFFFQWWRVSREPTSTKFWMERETKCSMPWNRQISVRGIVLAPRGLFQSDYWTPKTRRLFELCANIAVIWCVSTVASAVRTRWRWNVHRDTRLDASDKGLTAADQSTKWWTRTRMLSSRSRDRTFATASVSLSNSRWGWRGWIEIDE